MSYPYEDLSHDQFEDLVVHAMRKLFGEGVQGFATGPDGGRDARFDGKAERFPSASGPWKGITVGQAKHTNDTNRHFSDSSFGGAAVSSVISEEIVRLKKLVSDGELENYILFANRRLGGVSGPPLVRRISKEIEIPAQRIHLAGVEFLDRQLHDYPELLTLAAIDPLRGPMLPSSYDLAELILAISEELGTVGPKQRAEVAERVSFEQKNDLNSMSEDFAREIMDRYLRYEKQIRQFLADPGNEESVKRYEGAVEEFQLKIIAKQEERQKFDDVFNRIVDVLTGRDDVLRRDRALVRPMLFYMYWHCDIGKTPDA
jgi:hypothetical protein